MCADRVPVVSKPGGPTLSSLRADNDEAATPQNGFRISSPYRKLDPRQLAAVAATMWGSLAADPFAIRADLTTNAPSEDNASPPPIGIRLMPLGMSAMEGAPLNALIATPMTATILAPFDSAPAMANRSQKFAAQWRSAATRKAWRSHWRLILSICAEEGWTPLPLLEVNAAEVLAILAEAGFAYGSIRNVASTIRTAHRLNGLPDPTVGTYFSAVIGGIARVIGVDPIFRKDALFLDDLRATVRLARENHSVHALFEAALLNLGFFGAFRRSELVALRFPRDVHFLTDRLILDLHISKTNQMRRLEPVEIPYIPGDPLIDPGAMLKRWIQHLPGPGALFPKVTMTGRIGDQAVCDRTVDRTVKKYAGLLGYEPTLYGAHSLRSGFITEALLAGVPETEVAAHARHVSLDSLKTYYRPRDRNVRLVRQFVEGSASNVA